MLSKLFYVHISCDCFMFCHVLCIVYGIYCKIYYWNKVTVHHLKLCYFLMKKDNTMICGVLLNHCLTVNRIISKSVCLDTRLRDTSLKRCGVKSQFTNSVSCVSIIGVDASLTTVKQLNSDLTEHHKSLYYLFSLKNSITSNDAQLLYSSSIYIIIVGGLMVKSWR